MINNNAHRVFNHISSTDTSKMHQNIENDQYTGTQDNNLKYEKFNKQFEQLLKANVIASATERRVKDAREAPGSSPANGDVEVKNAKERRVKSDPSLRERRALFKNTCLPSLRKKLLTKL